MDPMGYPDLAEKTKVGENTVGINTTFQSQMLHVWIIYLLYVKNFYIQGEMLVNIPYMEHLGMFGYPNLAEKKNTSLVNRGVFACRGGSCGPICHLAAFMSSTETVPERSLPKIDLESRTTNVRSGLNSHYFHIIGDKLINPIVGVYRAPL